MSCGFVEGVLAKISRLVGDLDDVFRAHMMSKDRKTKSTKARCSMEAFELSCVEMATCTFLKVRVKE